jgi:hypothetical protein
MKKTINLVLIASFALSACGLGANTERPPRDFGPGSGSSAMPQDSQTGQPAAATADNDLEEASPDEVFVPDPVQIEAEEAEGEQPVYIYLFTHTEDHINHELSEERYTRLAPEVARLANANPEAELVWTIEFQGADAQTVGERNGLTGIADMLRNMADQGWIDFGYHAHHEPTYFNRPQFELDDDSSWAERVAALDEWISCEKDPLQGGCIADIGGGLTAVLEYFGEVEVVSGLGYETGDVGITGGAGRQAIVHYVPDYMVDFGFSDHSPASREAGYTELVDELMAILAPTAANSVGIFWMDDAVRINDAAAPTGLGQLNLDNGAASVARGMETVDRSHAQVMNAGFASKWIYTVQGAMSPTQWAYAHPEDPELPAESINPRFVIERNYQQNIAALEYLVTEFMPANPQSHFIGSEELLAMVAPDSYWQISAAELDGIARWLLQEWSDTPPAYATDGREFYSLRDAIGLLAGALNQNQNRGLMPEQQTLDLFYGPIEIAAPAEGLELTLNEVYQIAEQINRLIAAGDSAWQIDQGNILPASFSVDGGEINTAQALYALAMVYASSYADTPVSGVALPSTLAVPETHAMLDSLGCWTCYDSAWSLKPATLH